MDVIGVRSELRASDWRAGMLALQQVSDACDSSEAFALAGISALPRLVASEITTLSVCDLHSGSRQVIGSPGSGIGASDRAAFDRHFHQHPLVRYHGFDGGQGTRRVSDSQPFARFRHSALYSDYYRRIGIDHAMALPILVRGSRLVSFVFNRARRDFSDRERDLLDALQPPLARLYQLANSLDGARLDQATCGRNVDAWSLTPREHEVMRWVAAGKTDRDVALLLACSHRTVHKHLERVYAKLGVETRTAAVMRLFRGA